MSTAIIKYPNIHPTNVTSYISCQRLWKFPEGGSGSEPLIAKGSNGPIRVFEYVYIYVSTYESIIYPQSKLNQSAVANVNWQFPTWRPIMGESETDGDSSVSRLAGRIHALKLIHCYSVPRRISEEHFWRNYFYRVSVLRQSQELNTMANQAENNLTSAGSVEQAEGNTNVPQRAYTTYLSLFF